MTAELVPLMQALITVSGVVVSFVALIVTRVLRTLTGARGAAYRARRR